MSFFKLFPSAIVALIFCLQLLSEFALASRDLIPSCGEILQESSTHITGHFSEMAPQRGRTVGSSVNYLENESAYGSRPFLFWQEIALDRSVAMEAMGRLMSFAVEHREAPIEGNYILGLSQFSGDVRRYAEDTVRWYQGRIVEELRTAQEKLESILSSESDSGVVPVLNFGSAVPHTSLKVWLYRYKNKLFIGSAMGHLPHSPDQVAQVLKPYLHSDNPSFKQGLAFMPQVASQQEVAFFYERLEAFFSLLNARESRKSIVQLRQKAEWEARREVLLKVMKQASPNDTKLQATLSKMVQEIQSGSLTEVPQMMTYMQKSTRFHPTLWKAASKFVHHLQTLAAESSSFYSLINTRNEVVISDDRDGHRYRLHVHAGVWTDYRLNSNLQLKKEGEHLSGTQDGVWYRIEALDSPVNTEMVAQTALWLREIFESSGAVLHSRLEAL